VGPDAVEHRVEITVATQTDHPVTSGVKMTWAITSGVRISGP
jgi:hypothetical protein